MQSDISVSRVAGLVTNTVKDKIANANFLTAKWQFSGGSGWTFVGSDHDVRRDQMLRTCFVPLNLQPHTKYVYHKTDTLRDLPIISEQNFSNVFLWCATSRLPRSSQRAPVQAWQILGLTWVRLAPNVTIPRLLRSDYLNYGSTSMKFNIEKSMICLIWCQPDPFRL